MSGLMCFVGFILMLAAVGSIEQETMDFLNASLIGLIGAVLSVAGAIKLNDEHEGN